MKIIGLDVGTKRIGVARADSSTRIAVPVGFIPVDGSEWAELEEIAALNNTNLFVLGMPRSNEGNETQQSLYVRNFAKTLVGNIPGAKVRFQDESLTSVEAERRLKARKKNYMKGDIDAEAAAIILQDFLEDLKNPAPAPMPVAEEEEDDPNLIQDTIETAKAMTKKGTNKLKMSSKKTKHKIKKLPIFIVGAIVVLGLVGGGLFIKREMDRRAYEEYVAKMAAQKAEVFNFTIRPGETIFDIKKNLKAEGYTDAEIEEGFNADYNFDFLNERPAGATLEGYLFGETYEFYKTATVKEILTKFLTGMEAVIKNNNLVGKYTDRGLTLHEGITLASIVQKEALAGEEATIAQIFLSRLEYGWRLGSDVTVTYALDVVDPDRTTYQDNAAALSINSCYNTRINTGLPCGPISNPNLASLLAVAEPSDTAYLYFLTGDDHMMYYSYTEAEHNQNAALHCQNLCNASL